MLGVICVMTVAVIAFPVGVIFECLKIGFQGGQDVVQQLGDNLATDVAKAKSNGRETKNRGK